MNAQDAFGIGAVFYAVANLASMGFELSLREAILSLRSVRVLARTLGWSWAVGPALLTALGSFAVGAQVLFTLGMALSYTLDFGLNQAQRSALALGVCSPNGGAMFVAITAFPNLDPRLLVMILMAVPVPVIVWFALSKFFASRTGKTMAEGAAGVPVQSAKWNDTP